MFRCPWCESDPLLQKYHDEDWGVRPCTEQKHFEYLMLECAQAGLSWMTVLRRREAYREAYAGFDANAVAAFTDEQVEAMLNNPLLIRNRAKIKASIRNAKAFLRIQKEFGSFDDYLLSFFGGQPLVNHVDDDRNVPPVTAVSQDISANMKERGFSFMGATVVYSHLQAAGVVDDHVNGCFRKAALASVPPVAEQKLRIMAKVGKALNKAGATYGVGGSLMLYRNGLIPDFNDIDLLVALEDAYKADEVLSGLGEKAEERCAGVFETEVFRSYVVGGVGVDMMAGLGIRHEKGLYRHAFDESSLSSLRPVYGEMIPFCALEDWCLLYRLMPGKEYKAERIKEHLFSHGMKKPELISRMAQGNLPPETVQWMNDHYTGGKSMEETR